MVRLFEDLLDDLEKSVKSASQKIVDDIDDDARDWPGSRKYSCGLLVAYSKSVTKLQILQMKERISDWLDLRREIDDFSLVCFQNSHYGYLEAHNRLENMNYTDKIRVWIDFTFNHHMTSVPQFLKFVERMDNYFGHPDSVKFYQNDDARLSEELYKKDIKNILELYHGKKPRLGKNFRPEYYFEMLLKATELFMPGLENLPDECVNICRKIIDWYQLQLNYTSWSAMNRNGHYKSFNCMISPAITKKMNATTMSLKRLIRINGENYSTKPVLQNFNGIGQRDIIDAEYAKTLAAQPASIKKFEIRYTDPDDFFTFLGVLDLVTIRPEGLRPNVVQCTFWHYVDAKLPKDKFIKKARIVCDDFDDSDYECLMNQANQIFPSRLEQ